MIITLAHRAFTGGEEIHRLVRQHRRCAIQQRHVQMLPFAGTVPLLHSSQDSDRTIQSGYHIRYRDTDLLRLLAWLTGNQPVWFVRSVAMPPLLQWLWLRAPELGTALLLLVALWLWSRIPRRGPIQPVAEDNNRDYLQHLHASGYFQWRTEQQDTLLTALRQQAQARLNRYHHQRQQALARFDGRLTEKITQWRESLLDLRAEIEARLDFSDEGDVSEDLPHHWQIQLGALKTAIQTSLASLESGRIVREGIRVALAGAPNAGKSSLINALTKSDIAIVSDEAGTTRDVREVPLDINGQLFILLDLAGLRESDSKAEAEGVRRAQQAIETADIVLWLSAPDVPDIAAPDVAGQVLRIGTKSDLGLLPGVDVSISTGSGGDLIELRQRLDALAVGMTGAEPSLISHERDRLALSGALAALEETRRNLGDWALAAESLRRASAALERLIGRIDAEKVLDRLFSSFCIGK